MIKFEKTLAAQINHEDMPPSAKFVLKLYAKKEDIRTNNYVADVRVREFVDVDVIESLHAKIWQKYEVDMDIFDLNIWFSIWDEKCCQALRDIAASSIEDENNIGQISQNNQTINNDRNDHTYNDNDGMHVILTLSNSHGYTTFRVDYETFRDSLNECVQKIIYPFLMENDIITCD